MFILAVHFIVRNKQILTANSLSRSPIILDIFW